jgi:hypothetical protein
LSDSWPSGIYEMSSRLKGPPEGGLQRPTSVCALTGSLPLLQKSLAGSGHLVFLVRFSFLKSFCLFSFVRFDLARDGPDKAGEFARQRRDHHRRFLAPGAGELSVAVVQAPLGFPGRVGHAAG